MRVLVWIAESTWEPCVTQAAAHLPDAAEITLLHVTASDVAEVAAGGPAGLLGRRPRRPAEDLRALSDREAQELLESARERLGRDARLELRRGRVEREVVAASADADLLVICRDGRPGGGPKSFGPTSRFIADHVVCPLLVLPREPATGHSPTLPPLPSAPR